MLTRRDFRRVSFKGERLTGSLIIIDLLERDGQNPRLGIAVSKKFGNSPERNRFKRITREAFRLNKDKLPLCDFLIRPRKYAKDASSLQITAEMASLLHAVQLTKE